MTSYELGVDDALAYIAQGGDSITTRDMDAWFEAEFFNCPRPQWKLFSDRMLERSHDEPDGQSNYLAGVLGVFCLFSDTGLPTGRIERNYSFISNISVYFELESPSKVSIDEAKRFVKYNIQSLYSALVTMNTQMQQRFTDLQRDYSIKLSEVKKREQVNANLRGEIRDLEQQCLRLSPIKLEAESV
jgi:polyhydroxyalkanoate synthesis regulator phasin